jgi:hypothetical protein
MYETRILMISHFQHVLFCIERVTLLNCRAVILFRDVEYCGISSVNGTTSIQFLEFRPDKISLIPKNSSQFRNSVQFLQLQLIPDQTNSRNSEIETDSRNSEIETDSRNSEIETDSRNSEIETDSRNSEIETDSRNSEIETDSRNSEIETDSRNSVRFRFD